MKEKLERKLTNRHMSMIALGGCIGTGLFIATGGAISTAGPGGTIIAYCLIAIIVYFLMCSLGEMAAHSPITGTFCEYAGKYVDPAFGFSTGWNYWLNWSITVALEVFSAALIVQYWFPGSSIILWALLFLFIILFLNVFSVRVYGEVEYALSFVKVSTVIIFIIVGVLSILGLIGSGTEAVGFSNWSSDKIFSGGFNGFLAVFIIAGFSFQGTELIGVAAGEAKDPSKSIPRAIKQTFWRLFLFYILSVLIICFIIPFDSPFLVNTKGNVAMSPFTIIFKNIGIESAANIMNVVILTAVLSACNASMYSATRILWHLGRTNQAPKIFGKVNQKGVPMVALVATSLVGLAFLPATIFPNGFIFMALLEFSSLTGFIAWFAIALSHYRFRKAYLLQGKDLSELPFKAKWFPWAPLFALGFMVVIIFGQSFDIYLNKESYATTADIIWHLLLIYIALIIFLLVHFGYKFIKKTKLIKLEDCDLSSLRE